MAARNCVMKFVVTRLLSLKPEPSYSSTSSIGRSSAPRNPSIAFTPFSRVPGGPIFCAPMMSSRLSATTLRLWWFIFVNISPNGGAGISAISSAPSGTLPLMTSPATLTPFSSNTVFIAPPANRAGSCKAKRLFAECPPCGISPEIL